MSQSSLVNLDKAVVEGFGDQWTIFDQTHASEASERCEFDSYFSSFRWDLVDGNSVGFDMGCGTGRWDKFIAPKVGHLHCIEPSAAINVAKRMLSDFSNVSYHQGGLSDQILSANSMDFGICLGVLHYVPDAAMGIRCCAEMLKPGAPLLVYIYYRFDNRPSWFRMIWKITDIFRRGISRLPFRLRRTVTNMIAAVIYWPAASLAHAAEKAGINVANWPLSSYRNMPFYSMKTDSLDRFGTRREHRYTRAEIKAMMEDAGLANIHFGEDTPYWSACGTKRT